ncbi:MAG: hypothetical protein JSR24_07845 [Proteobacteria bacterium]|nr:hypothetical protein [Pseudomonadota bacterium]
MNGSKKSGVNLLWRSSAGSSVLSTPNRHLELYAEWGFEPRPPIDLFVHCWPEPTEGMAFLVATKHREGRPVLRCKIHGPLPDHADAVICLRFRTADAPEIDPALGLIAAARLQLEVLGNLSQAVLAVGRGSNYVEGWHLVQKGMVATRTSRLAPADLGLEKEPMFLELRVPLAALGLGAPVVCFEVSDFYLGQGADALAMAS